MRVLGAIIVTLLVAACAPEPPPSPVRVAHPSQLAGTVWEVVAVGDRAVALRESIQLAIDESGRVSGVTGCNSLAGAVTYDHTTGAVAFTDLVTTKRACADPAVAALEAGVLAGLRAAEAASVDEVGRLVLAGAGPTILLTVGPEPGAPPIDRQPAPS